MVVEENQMSSNIDPRCIMVQNALNFVDSMNVQDVLKKFYMLKHVPIFGTLYLNGKMYLKDRFIIILM